MQLRCPNVFCDYLGFTTPHEPYLEIPPAQVRVGVFAILSARISRQLVSGESAPTQERVKRHAICVTIGGDEAIAWKSHRKVALATQ